jgi:intracellular septation protein
MNYLFLVPLALFFGVYKLYGIYAATAVLMATTSVQMAWIYWKTRTLSRNNVATLALVLGLGALTLLFHNDLFIKWKPTLIYWALALAMLVSAFIGERKTLLERALADAMKEATEPPGQPLPAHAWQRANFAWVIFWILMGGANLYIAYMFDSDTWVNFKIFGATGLMLVFTVLQVFYLYKIANSGAKQI